MLNKYLNNPLLIDLIACVFLGVIIHLLRPFLRDQLTLPQMDSIVKSMDSIVKVATPLIGFLLTIVGVIVTFKNNFDSTNSNNIHANVENVPDPNIPPPTTVFDKTVSKKEQFYNSNLHKKVMRVFLKAVYEFTFVVFLFLSFQSGLFNLSRFWAMLLTSLGLTIIVLALLRSLYIYKLFLNVHAKE